VTYPALSLYIYIFSDFKI